VIVRQFLGGASRPRFRAHAIFSIFVVRINDPAPVKIPGKRSNCQIVAPIPKKRSSIQNRLGYVGTPFTSLYRRFSLALCDLLRAFYGYQGFACTDFALPGETISMSEDSPGIWARKTAAKVSGR